jgi:hypothetical protein
LAPPDPLWGEPAAVEATLLTEAQQHMARFAPLVRAHGSIELKLMPVGRYTMGSSRREPGRRANEGQRTVELRRPFYLGTREISNAEFHEFRPEHKSGIFGGVSLNLDNQPVANVSWQDAAAYCNWLSQRDGLPLAAQSLAVLRGLGLADDSEHALVQVDLTDLKIDELRHAQASGIDGCQRGAALEAWDCLQEAHDLVGAQHDRQLARLACIADALRNGILAECHTVEKAQRTHDLIERRPGYPDRHQVDLEGADILQLETIGGPTEIPAQLRYRGKVGSLRRRRQIADRHVLDHAAAKRAQISHLKTPV